MHFRMALIKKRIRRKVIRDKAILSKKLKSFPVEFPFWESVNILLISADRAEICPLTFPIKSEMSSGEAFVIVRF